MGRGAPFAGSSRAGPAARRGPRRGRPRRGGRAEWWRATGFQNNIAIMEASEIAMEPAGRFGLAVRPAVPAPVVVGGAVRRPSVRRPSVRRSPVRRPLCPPAPPLIPLDSQWSSSSVRSTSTSPVRLDRLPGRGGNRAGARVRGLPRRQGRQPGSCGAAGRRAGGHGRDGRGGCLCRPCPCPAAGGGSRSLAGRGGRRAHGLCDDLGGRGDRREHHRGRFRGQHAGDPLPDPGRAAGRGAHRAVAARNTARREPAPRGARGAARAPYPAERRPRVPGPGRRSRRPRSPHRERRSRSSRSRPTRGAGTSPCEAFRHGSRAASD